MRCDGSRLKAYKSVSQQNYMLLYITLTIKTSASNSGNVSMPIKFKFLISPESIQTIFKLLKSALNAVHLSYQLIDCFRITFLLHLKFLKQIQYRLLSVDIIDK